MTFSLSLAISPLIARTADAEGVRRPEATDGDLLTPTTGAVHRRNAEWTNS